MTKSYKQIDLGLQLNLLKIVMLLSYFLIKQAFILNVGLHVSIVFKARAPGMSVFILSV